MEKSDRLPSYDLYIGGRWVPSSGPERFPTFNPFTRQPWATISQADASDVASAIAAARHAYETTWRGTSGLERGRLLFKLADLVDGSAERIGNLETTDNGKVIRETTGQARYLARVLRFYAGYADKLWGKVIPLDRGDVFDYAALEPLGVVGLIIAWNSPMAMLGNKAAAALAAGNCVVVKPSEHASVTTLEFCKLVEEAGFPAGVFNVVTGDARTGDALAKAEGLDKISFTGSGTAGRLVAAAAGRTLTPVIMELGGKSPNIIFADADLKKASTGAFAGIFGATGQTCIAGSRLLVQRIVYDEVVTHIVERAPAIRLGDPRMAETEMGTVANEPQFNRIMDYIGSAKSEGATLMTGGGRATGEALGDGLFIQPTVFAEVRNDMRLAQEEIFGPVLAIIPFDTEEEAITIANGTSYGLASGIWTQDINRAMRVSRAMRSGLVWINTYRAVAAQMPFGGVKDSGFGRERGEEGLMEFMTAKNVMINYSDDERDPFAIQT
ncbi:aldehyde dehydrogenase [Mesorhizobium sp. M7A.F.Ca.US.006.01.1.1]|uniref:aldehyde dehydrogenase n=1 Tax=Mesorhizobium sp. M7A.F.Ca.US.006.01.1.1 TaxID=2496707 RepID=UPI000FCB2951|nr:aldehyde dehydrogenase [Mesorhizobium sp. M7A.F.Ca.US.006.01.1.1]RUZ77976.1 aldehyde dehydrogenase [Mesorhizobium sp. M7A.F.Ca.US.006.01.1.1]